MNQRLASKVTLVVLIFLAFLALAAWFGITNIMAIHDSVAYLEAQSLKRLEASARLSVALTRAASEAETFALGGSEENLTEAWGAITDARNALAEFEILRQQEQKYPFHQSLQDNIEYQQLQQRQVALIETATTLANTVASRDRVTTAQVLENQEQFEEAIEDLNDETHKLVASDTAAAIAAVTQSIQRGIISVGAAFGSIIVLVLIAQILLWHKIIKPVNSLALASNNVARGQFDQQVQVTSNDEIGALQQTFNTMVQSLRIQRTTLEAQRNELAQALNEAREARSRAEQANQLKSQFLANMSHELRTPLNAIINFTRILSAGMRGPVNDDQRDYLNRVRQSGEHLLGMINDILDLSKIEAGRMELHREPLQIAEVVQSIMATATGLIKEKPITLLQELGPDLPLIMADRTRVRQILLNLLSNAAKFTEDGTITVRVARQDDELVIGVTDTGIGIAEEHLTTIFEEFSQIDGESNRRYEGTGLGLAICRSLIGMHGGRIWVESTPEVGSTFSFSLPITADQHKGEAAANPTPEVHLAKAGIPVLVIDDNAGAIEIVSAYLSQDGYCVHPVTDSRMALAEARRIAPAAIILDILMPHKDGWEVLTEIKADPQLHTIPVILYSIVEEHQLGLTLGANAYLLKPIDGEQLRATVARLVTPPATIMVIDDDPNALEIVAQQLTLGNTHQVITAQGGQAGLARIAETQPDLIVLDLMMPEVDGFCVLEQLAQNPATSTIPVIVLSAKELTAQERTFLNQRVQTLLAKGSTSSEQLLGSVATLLRTTISDPGAATHHTHLN